MASRKMEIIEAVMRASADHDEIVGIQWLPRGSMGER